MKREMLLSGLLGGIVIFAWLVVSRGPLPLSGDLPRPIPNDKQIHATLKERLTDPGIYYCPDSSEDNRVFYPSYGDEPLFTIIVSGRTPNTYLGQLLFEVCCIFIAPLIAAWLLSMASGRILRSFPRRVVFVIVLGVFLSAYGYISSEAPINVIALSSLHTLITWGLAGLVIAWRINPGKRMAA